MSITKTSAQGKLRLAGVLNPLSVAGLRHLYNGLFPVTCEAKITMASIPLPQPQQCPECMTVLGAASELYSRIAVCDHCGYHFVWSASNRVEHLADPGSFRPIGRHIQPVDFLGFVDEYPYSTRLLSSQQQTRLNGAILTGRCRIGGTETVLAVLDFFFVVLREALGGSLTTSGGTSTQTRTITPWHILPIIVASTQGTTIERRRWYHE